MGLMDNIKNAQEAMAGGVPDTTGGAVGGLEQAQWMQRIATDGLDGEGTITSLDKTGNVDPGGANEYAIKVDANLGGESYEATAMQFLHPSSEDSYKVGGKFEFKADPDDKTRILLMGGLD